MVLCQYLFIFIEDYSTEILFSLRETKPRHNIKYIRIVVRNTRDITKNKSTYDASYSPMEIRIIKTKVKTLKKKRIVKKSLKIGSSLHEIHKIIQTTTVFGIFTDILNQIIPECVTTMNRREENHVKEKYE